MLFCRQNVSLKRVYHLQKLFCTLAFEVTEADSHQQKVQILSFYRMSGIFQLPSPLHTQRRKILANDFSALPQLSLAIKCGLECIQRIWDIIFKLQASLSWPCANFRTFRLVQSMQNSVFVPVPSRFACLCVP